MTVLNINITRFTKEMHDIVDYQLQCTDDEDCKRFPYLATAMCEDNPTDDFFSGSGDNSNNDSNDPTSSGTGPTPRVNIAIITGPSNINMSLPPIILHTDSVPTTTLPTTDSADISIIANKSDNNTNSNNFRDKFKTNQNSGISVLHLELCYLLLPTLLGMLYIF